MASMITEDGRRGNRLSRRDLSPQSASRYSDGGSVADSSVMEPHGRRAYDQHPTAASSVVSEASTAPAVTYVASARGRGDTGHADAELRALRAEVEELRASRQEATSSSKTLKQVFHKNATLLQAQVQQWREATAAAQREASVAKARVADLQERCSTLERAATKARKEAADAAARATEVRDVGGYCG